MADEKFDEKELEKKDEKSPEEKNWEEKYRRDPLGSIIWACILIWAGLVFLADNLKLIDFRVIPGLPSGFNSEPWSWILIGAGILILIEVVIRLTVPDYRRPVMGSIFLAIVLIGIGLGNLFNWNITGALILIALGLMIILRGVFREQKK